MARVAYVKLFPEPQHDPSAPGEKVAFIRASIFSESP